MQIKKHFNPVPHEHVLQWVCSTRLNARNKFLYNMIFKKKKAQITFIHGKKKGTCFQLMHILFVSHTYMYISTDNRYRRCRNSSTLKLLHASIRESYRLLSPKRCSWWKNCILFGHHSISTTASHLHTWHYL